MPIEIRELIIKAEIADSQNPVSQSRSMDRGDAAPERLVVECVRRVMEILSEKEDR